MAEISLKEWHKLSTRAQKWVFRKLGIYKESDLNKFKTIYKEDLLGYKNVSKTTYREVLKYLDTYYPDVRFKGEVKQTETLYSVLNRLIEEFGQFGKIYNYPSQADYLRDFVRFLEEQGFRIKRYC
jgi:hypothetical protein